MDKKFLWLILAFAAAGVLFVMGSNMLADDTIGNPFSGEPDTNRGAWYDETWRASGFYNLQQIGASANFQYVYSSTNPPAVIYDGPVASPDAVITEWDVTGHVHFSSGL